MSAKQSHFCCQTDEHGASSVSSPDVPSNILERFSRVKTGEGISPCVPSAGPSVPPSPGCCSVGWSQHESYFWLSGYLTLHNPQRFRPRSFGFVCERHFRDNDLPSTAPLLRPRAGRVVPWWWLWVSTAKPRSTVITTPGRILQISASPVPLAPRVELQTQEAGCWILLLWHASSLAFSPDMEVCELRRLERAWRWGRSLSLIGEKWQIHILISTLFYWRSHRMAFKVLSNLPSKPFAKNLTYNSCSLNA